MHLLQALEKLIGPVHQNPQSGPILAQRPPNTAQQLQHVSAQPEVQAQGQPPDYTYNPNMATNIPFSSHNLAQILALARQPIAQRQAQPQVQAPGNMPIGGFQNAQSPQNFANQPIGINPNNFSATQIKY